jgi:hypothetical protein
VTPTMPTITVWLPEARVAVGDRAVIGMERNAGPIREIGEGECSTY